MSTTSWVLIVVGGLVALDVMFDVLGVALLVKALFRGGDRRDR